MINEDIRIKKIFLSMDGRRGLLIGTDKMGGRHEMYCTARRAIASTVIDQLIRIRALVAIDPKPLTEIQKDYLNQLIQVDSISQWIEKLESAQVRTNITTLKRALFIEIFSRKSLKN